MKQIKLFFATTLLAVCFVITNSCFQTTISGSLFVPGVFVASTPCDDVSKTMLRIPSGTKCELMKWNLTDKDRNLMVGNVDCSYTLNGVKK